MAKIDKDIEQAILDFEKPCSVVVRLYLRKRRRFLNIIYLWLTSLSGKKRVLFREMLTKTKDLRKKIAFCRAVERFREKARLAFESEGLSIDK